MRWTLVVSFVLAGCSSDGAGGGAGGGGGCTEAADNCTAETICISTSCVAAFGRIYSIHDVVVHVPTTDPNGAGWDVGNGAPDLKLDISVNGTTVATAPAVPDQFMATFAGPYNVTLIAGSSLVITALDEDVTTDDTAFICEVSPVSAGQLRSRSLSCAGAGSSLSFEIDPR
jgi:hypothetical protein